MKKQFGRQFLTEELHLADRDHDVKNVFVTAFGPAGSGKSRLVNTQCYTLCCTEEQRESEGYGFPLLSFRNNQAVTVLQYVQYWDDPGLHIDYVDTETLGPVNKGHANTLKELWGDQRMCMVSRKP